MLNRTKSESLKGPRHDPTVPLEEQEAPTVTKYAGLCLHCMRAGDCTFPRDESRPVLACDEFDGGHTAPRHASRVNTSTVILVEPILAPAFDVPPDARGLCRTCARLSDCTFPKSAGGVWHCEEFE
jgi:hypothetical protein